MIEVRETASTVGELIELLQKFKLDATIDFKGLYYGSTSFYVRQKEDGTVMIYECVGKQP